jgi:hypothetical protein
MVRHDQSSANTIAIQTGGENDPPTLNVMDDERPLKTANR